MRRFIAGAGLAAAIVTGAHIGGGEAAGAETSDICAPVFDSANTGDQSGFLRDQIADYATHGIEVHVQILADGQSRDITSEDAAKDFAEGLYTDCDWQDPDVIDVVLAVDTHKGFVLTKGDAINQVPNSVVDSSNPAFVENLRDSSTPYQHDVAELLQDLSPYADSPVTGNGDDADKASSEHDSQDKSPEMPDLPYGQIGLGVLGVGALTAVTARAKRGLSILQAQKGADSAADTAQGIALTSQLDADKLLNIIPDDDANDSRQMRRALDDAISELEQGQTTVADTYRGQRHRFWPSLDIVESAANPVHELADKTTKTAGELDTEIATLSGRIGTIDATVESFGSLIDGFEAAIASLEQSGWDMGPCRDLLTDYRQQQESIKQLRSHNYVDKPADMVDALDDSITTETQRAQALPERFDMNTTTHAEQSTQIAERHTAVDAASTTLQSMRDSYDASCTRDIDTQDAQLRELLDKLEELQSTVTDSISLQSAAAVTMIEKTQSDIQATLGQIDSGVKTIQGRETLLAGLSRDLPGEFAGLADDARDGIQFARTNYGDDTEPDTYAALEALEQEVAQARHGLDDSKPKLLELKAVAERLGGKQDELDNRARAEWQEMRELRSSIDAAATANASALSSLESYVNSHSDVDGSTKAAARSIQLIRGDTTASRTNMRNQVQDLTALDSRIASVLSDAKRDVRQAEETRERERQRRAAEEAAERSRAAAAASTTWNISSGSGPSSGGGGVSW